MFDFVKISASKFYRAQEVERVVEFCPPDVDISNVAKVLSLSVNAKCVGVNGADGYAEVDGRASFKLIYLDKDGLSHGVDYNADFKVKVDGEYQDGDNLNCNIRVVETDCNAQDTLTLSAVLMVEVVAIKHDDIEVLQDADNCYKSQKEVFIPKFLANKTSVAPFDDEETVGGDVTSVLSLTTSVALKEVLVDDGVVRAKSNVIGRVVYVEGGEIKERVFDIPLEDEFSMDDVAQGDTAKVVATVKNAKIILQGVTDDNVIRLEGEVQYKVWAFRCEKVSIVGDMFMLTNECEIERKEARYTCFDGCGFFQERVSGNLSLADTKAPALDVVALPYASCYTTRSRVLEDNTLEVEGVVNTDVIYMDENGANSVRAEIPFALSIDSNTTFSKVVKVDCKVGSIGAIIKRDREFEINLTLIVEACGFSPLEFSYISSVAVGEEKEQNTSGLSIYVAGEGEDMLTVCKALTAMPEDILIQNPDLTFPLTEGTRIIYFRHID